MVMMMMMMMRMMIPVLFFYNGDMLMTQDGYNPIREDMRLQNVVIDKDDVTMETDGRRKETGNINQDDDEFK